MKKVFLSFVLLFALVFCLVACGEEVGEPEDVTPSIDITIDSWGLYVGDVVNVKAEVKNANIADLVWEMDDDTIIKLEDGKVTALKVGETNLYARIGDASDMVHIVVVEKGYDIAYELNGGQVEGQLVTSRKEADVVELPTPTKEGYTFAGWYDNAEFSGKAITKLDSNNLTVAKVFAKWEEKQYKITYNLIDLDGEEKVNTVKVNFKDDYTLVDPEFDATANIFSGWCTDSKYIYQIKTIKGGTMEKDTINVYGTIVSKSQTVKVNYDLNGGSTTYRNRAAVVKDFIADYNAVLSKTYKNADAFGSDNYSPTNFQTFYAGKLKDGTKVMDKWGWLAEYLYDISKAQLTSSNCNVTGLKNLLAGTFDESNDDKYGLSYAFRGFLQGKQLRPDSSYQSVDFSVYANANGFWSYLSKAQSYSETVSASEPTFPTLIMKEGYEFVGWCLDKDGEVEAKNLYFPTTIYAKWTEKYPVTGITIGNKQAEISKFEQLQLEWTIKPANANIQSVKFTSSDETIATVSPDGLIKALQPGTVTIKILSDSMSKLDDSFELTVTTPNYFDVSYKTVSYVLPGESIELLATYKGKDAKNNKINWQSLDAAYATVDANGKVTGVKPGFAKIRATAEGTSDSFDFGVTVLDANAAAVVKFMAESNNANVFTRYDLGIGAGTPVYYSDIVGSISKVLFGDLKIDKTYYDKLPSGTKNNGPMESVEFITVHYTGNMSKGADADNNCSYFNELSYQASIHYVTGWSNLYNKTPGEDDYYAFAGLNEKYAAWHAGDGTSVRFDWYPTGVKVKDTDPQWPVWGISANGKFTMNGVETIINVPEGSTEETKAVKGDTFVCNGVEQPCINQLGLGFKIVDGEYYMGTTYWCYSQIGAGRICSRGGNLRSIGIESCVDPGSDLWHTWQTTAQLVATLMEKYNLDITRVVGHHFYTAKDCPQPMLENNNEIWWQFIDLVKAEYQKLTTFKDYEITMTIDSSDVSVSKYGRVTQTSAPQSIIYTVKMTNKTNPSDVQTIKLASICEATYEK